MALHVSSRLSKQCVRRRTRRSRLFAERLEGRGLLSTDLGFGALLDGSVSDRETEPNDTLQTAVVLTPGVPASGTITPNDLDLFRLALDDGQRIVSRVQAEGTSTRLSLLDEMGRLLIQSDGIAPGDRENRIDQNVIAGTYFLRVEDLSGPGNYTLEVDLTTGSVPFQRVPVGDAPITVATSDFDGDGRLDLVTANAASDDISVLLGRGDGTFRDPVRFAVGALPLALVAGDFNGDGRPDLATANGFSYDVSVLLGRGDGTFQEQRRLAVGDGPSTLVVSDLNGDGRPDLATANRGRFDYESFTYVGSDVSVLLGRGDGTFQEERRLAVGDGPSALVVEDFDGDALPDLATANTGSNEVSVLLGHGDGTFQERRRLAVGDFPTSLVVSDLNGDGRPDLATANRGSSDVTVLLGRGDGSFQEQLRLAVGAFPSSLEVSDLDGDGRPDLATANSESNDVAVLLGRGDGTFRAPVRFAAGDFPTDLVVGDFNGDGRPDLATANAGSDDISIGLGLGDGRFAAPTPLATFPHATPLVSDLDADGVADVLVINRAGEILWRRGRPQEPGSFDPPIIVNPSAPSNDIAVVGSFQGPLIASVDARADSVSLFARRDDRFVRIGSLLTGRRPAQITAADLDSDGSTDLLVRNAIDGTASIYLGDNIGSFRKVTDDLPIGLGASDIRLADLDRSGSVDLIVTNQTTGDVRILFNRGDATFTREARYYAGNGPYGLVGDLDTPTLTSLEGTVSVDVGTFVRRVVPGVATVEPAPALDLVTVNPGSNTLGVLAGLGGGAFANPRRVVTDGPIQVVRTADFNGDGVSDVALLGASHVTIHLSDGRGEFVNPFLSDAGSNPTGLTVSDADGDGRLDLLVGNDFGDVLVLLGNGDGTFRPFRKADRGVALAVADLDGDGRDDFVFASQDRDRVVVEFGGAGTTVVDDRSSGLLAPGAVVLHDLNGDGRSDLIVANSGGNNALVYLGRGGGQFESALAFSTGTNPVAITVADVNVDATGRGDGIPDLMVTNRGSNDVTVLLGSGQGAGWTFSPGTRFQAGTGPVNTLVQDFDNDAKPDLAISNSLSNDVRLVPGVGLGNFADQRSRTIAVGENPGPLFVGNFDTNPGTDLVTLNRESSDLTLVSGFASGAGIPQRIPSGGLAPAAGFAGDFNFDGISDLVVANNGDGRLALFLGGNTGLGLSQILTPTATGLPHPTALALDSVGDGLLTFFASTEGLEAATLLAFSFGGVESGPPAFDLLGPESPVIPPGPGSIIEFPRLVPLRGLQSGGFNLNVFTNLLIDHHGGGILAMSLGSGEGPSLEQVIASTDLTSPIALAFDSFGGGLFSFHVDTGGIDLATRLVLILGIGDGLVGSSIQTLLSTLQPRGPIPTLSGGIPLLARLLSPRGSALTLVATLLTVSLETGAIPSDATGFPDGVVTPVPFQTTAANRPRPGHAAAGTDTTAEAVGEMDEPGDPSPQTPPDWVRLLVDLDEALEHSRRASHDQVFADDEPSTPAQRMLSGIEVLLDDWWPTVRHPGSLARGFPSIRERVVRAIDEAIRPWRPEAPHLPQTAPPVVVEPTSAAPVIEEPADPARPPGGSTPSSPEGGLARTEQVSVSLVLAAALLAYRVAHHRRRPADHRQEGPVRGP